MYLEVPDSDFKVVTSDDLMSLMPPYEGMDEWQKCQYINMVNMWLEHKALGGRYDWSRNDPHDGVLKHVIFRNYRLGKSSGKGLTHCVGFTLEHFFRTWKEYLGDRYESDEDMSLEIAKQLRGYFFIYEDDDTYIRGMRDGVQVLAKHLKEKGSDFGLTFHSHGDVYACRFGDYLQIQSFQDPFASGSGHSAIFLGLEKREYKGEEITAARLFHSNGSNAFGMSSGIGISWWIVGKKEKSTGFVRTFHTGSIRELKSE